MYPILFCRLLRVFKLLTVSNLKSNLHIHDVDCRTLKITKNKKMMNTVMKKKLVRKNDDMKSPTFSPQCISSS